MREQPDNQAKSIQTGGGSVIEGSIETGGGDFVGHDKVTIGAIINNLFGGDSEAIRKQRNRQAMLRLVKEIWIKGILEPSLAKHVLIDLTLALQPQAVNRPGDALLP